VKSAIITIRNLTPFGSPCKTHLAKLNSVDANYPVRRKD
jgi:hypothetical protein